MVIETLYLQGFVNKLLVYRDASRYVRESEGKRYRFARYFFFSEGGEEVFSKSDIS